MARDVEIRSETANDHAAIRAVNESAFGTPAEADLVDKLRQLTNPIISLVAIAQDEVVGHILLSPVTIVGHPKKNIMGLGPMGVKPDHQRRGVGAALVREGLKQVAEVDAGAVVVLGHNTYYPRFGFRPAHQFGIRCEFDVPPEAFMAIELRPDYLKNTSGIAKYHAVFQEV